MKGVEGDSNNLRQSYEEARAANQMLGEQVQRLEDVCCELKTELYNTRNHNATLQRQVSQLSQFSNLDPTVMNDIGFYTFCVKAL